MSKKRIRAQLRKANNNHANGKHDGMFDSYVLSATAESYEQMVEQMAKAIDPDAKELCEHFERRMNMGSTEPWYDYRKEADQKARAALCAIGIKPPKKGRKCPDGQCVKHRNINGGCDLCGAPSL